MKIEYRKVSEDGKTIQITCPGERWYAFGNGTEFKPSCTWICSYYPKGREYMKWLASKGWDEAEEIKNAAGDKGSKVHAVCSDLMAGKEVKIDDKYLNGSTGNMEELTAEEWECIISFSNFWKKYNPKVLLKDLTVWSEEDNYAGSLDVVLEIYGEIWLTDFKTSQYIWPSHEIQVSSYKKALLEMKTSIDRIDRLGILQLGYKKNKSGFKLTEVKDQFDLFLAAKKIWEKETKGTHVFQKDYPTSIIL